MIKSSKKVYKYLLKKYFFDHDIKLKVIKFLLIGLLNTSVSYFAYLSIGKFFGYKVSYVLSFLLNTLLNYIFYKRVFSVNYKASSKNILLYFVYYIFSAAISFVIFLILIDFLEIHEYFAPFLVLAIMVNLNFLFNLIFFKKR